MILLMISYGMVIVLGLLISNAAWFTRGAGSGNGSNAGVFTSSCGSGAGEYAFIATRFIIVT